MPIGPIGADRIMPTKKHPINIDIIAAIFWKNAHFSKVLSKLNFASLNRIFENSYKVTNNTDILSNFDQKNRFLFPVSSKKH